MSIASRIVIAAAASLPRAGRDRYREQWLADLQDARELDIRPAEIALGAVIFAATLRRPVPKLPELTELQVARRTRVAAGLALSGAVVGLTGYAGMMTGDLYNPDAAASALRVSAIGYAVFASILSLTFALITRAMRPRVRWALLLLSVAAASPIVQLLAQPSLGGSWNPALDPSAAAYLVAVVPLIAGWFLLRTQRTKSARDPKASVTSGAVVLLVSAASLANAVVLWSLRLPLVFGDGPKDSSNPYYVQWLALKEQFEALMASVFVGWGVGSVLLATAVAVLAFWGRLSGREIVGTTVGASALAVVAGAGLLGFLQLAQFGIVPDGEVALVLSVGRMALVGAILFVAIAGPTTGNRAEADAGPGVSSEGVEGASRA